MTTVQLFQEKKGRKKRERKISTLLVTELIKPLGAESSEALQRTSLYSIKAVRGDETLVPGILFHRAHRAQEVL